MIASPPVERLRRISRRRRPPASFRCDRGSASSCDDARAARRIQRRQQQRRLHLRRGDRDLVVDADRPARRPVSVTGIRPPARAAVIRRAEQPAAAPAPGAIGRERSEASPVNTAVIGVVAIAPMTRREPVPELPKSSTSSGSVQPPTPGPADAPAPRRRRGSPWRQSRAGPRRCSARLRLPKGR